MERKCDSCGKLVYVCEECREKHIQEFREKRKAGRPKSHKPAGLWDVKDAKASSTRLSPKQREIKKARQELKQKWLTLKDDTE